MMRLAGALPFLIALAGCAQPIVPVVETALPVRDPLYTPDRVVPGRLEYAPDGMTFPPVLTERFTYPTQSEANAAYRRSLLSAAANGVYPASVWLFGCKPGALDGQTARVTRYNGPVVHCATDFLDAGGRRVHRETENFYYYAGVWNMRPVEPPRTIVPWRNRERSPKDPWRWLPGRERYE